MSVSLAHASTIAAHAVSSWSEEPGSSLRLVSPSSPPPPPAPSPSLDPGSASDDVLVEDLCPAFDADVVDAGGIDLLVLRIPAQALPERGYIQAHAVHCLLRPSLLELELYSAPRKLSRRRPRLLSVGVWTVGAYAKWRSELRLDFLVLDAVDACLRRQLPPGGGVVTIFEVGGPLASGDGMSFRA